MSKPRVTIRHPVGMSYLVVSRSTKAKSRGGSCFFTHAPTEKTIHTASKIREYFQMRREFIDHSHRGSDGGPRFCSANSGRSLAWGNYTRPCAERCVLANAPYELTLTLPIMAIPLEMSQTNQPDKRHPGAESPPLSEHSTNAARVPRSRYRQSTAGRATRRIPACRL